MRGCAEEKEGESSTVGYGNLQVRYICNKDKERSTLERLRDGEQLLELQEILLHLENVICYTYATVQDTMRT